jgi:opacity protein-like surface antigen
MSPAKKSIAMVLMLAMVCLSVPNLAGSDGGGITRKSDREGSWDFYLPLTYSEDATVNGQGGSHAKINDDFGFGFGAGYNPNDHFQIGGLFNWSSRSYDATVVRNDGTSAEYGNYMEIATLALNGTYYILDSNFTPFVTGMLGYTWIDTNIQEGPSSGYCWWDPWYGYVCSYYVPTKTEDEWTYGAGLGVRYDFNKAFSMQCSYNRSWVDFENSDGTPSFGVWRLDFIFRMF